MQQLSRDKFDRFPRATTEFTLCVLDRYGLRDHWPARPTLTPQIRFLYIGSRVCSALPSDPASRRRPCASLSLRVHQAVKRTCASKLSNMLGVPKKRAAEYSAARRHSQNNLCSLTRHDLPESARICRDFSRSRRRAVRVTRSVHPRGP